MGVTDKIRQAFDECTVMAGVKNDFECVYITKAAAMLYLNEIDDENAKLRKLVSWMYDRMDESCAVQYPYAPTPISYDRLMQAQARARELGIEVSE